MYSPKQNTAACLHALLPVCLESGPRLLGNAVTSLRQSIAGSINGFSLTGYINKQGKYRRQVLQIFLTIKTPCSGGHAHAAPVAVLTFKVIQGE